MSGWRDASWIPEESPGGVGDPELWIDAQTLEIHGAQAPALVRFTLAANGNGPWIGAQIQFGNYPGADGSITYMVVGRRFSQANHGRPYYVARIPESREEPDER